MALPLCLPGLAQLSADSGDDFHGGFPQAHTLHAPVVARRRLSGDRLSAAAGELAVFTGVAWEEDSHGEHGVKRDNLYLFLSSILFKRSSN